MELARRGRFAVPARNGIELDPSSYPIYHVSLVSSSWLTRLRKCSNAWLVHTVNYPEACFLRPVVALFSSAPQTFVGNLCFNGNVCSTLFPPSRGSVLHDTLLAHLPLQRSPAEFECLDTSTQCVFVSILNKTALFSTTEVGGPLSTCKSFLVGVYQFCEH